MAIRIGSCNSTTIFVEYIKKGQMGMYHGLQCLQVHRWLSCERTSSHPSDIPQGREWLFESPGENHLQSLSTSKRDIRTDGHEP